MKLFVIALMGVFVIFRPPVLYAEPTQEMLQGCRTIVRDSFSNGDSIQIPQSFHTGLCAGSFRVIQTIIKYADGTNKRIFRVCSPKIGILQIISIFVKYAEDNPQRLHEDYFKLALESLRKAFPCPYY